jgi:Plasmid pRiA4b ORF-3-like protein
VIAPLNNPPEPSSPLYELKVTLRGSKPAIWRRLQVPGSIKLNRLHQVLQVAMGWTDSHLHQFSFAGDEQSPPHQRAHATKHDAKLINRRGRYARVRHAGTLPESIPTVLSLTPGISRSRTAAGRAEQKISANSSQVGPVNFVGPPSSQHADWKLALRKLGS